MDKRQNNKVTMFLNSQTLLTARSAIMNPVVNYAAYSTEYNSNVGKIRGFTELRQYNQMGNADEKRQMRDKLIPFILEGSSRLIALSLATSNKVLIKEIDYTISDLHNMDEIEFTDAAMAVKDRVQSNLLALAAYGSNATTQTNFQAAITAYTLAARKPSAASLSQKVATQKIDECIALAEASLKKIDILVNMLRFQQPDFYNEYWMTRRIGKFGTRRTSVIGRVYEAMNKETIKGVSVTFTLDPSSPNYKEGMKPIVKISAEKGGFIIRNLNAGIYQVTAKKVGYKDLSLNIAVNDDETTNIVIEMERLVLDIIK